MSLEEHTYLNLNLCFWKSASHFRTLKSSHLSRTKTLFSPHYTPKNNQAPLQGWSSSTTGHSHLFSFYSSHFIFTEIQLKMLWPRENITLESRGLENDVQEILLIFQGHFRILCSSRIKRTKQPWKPYGVLPHETFARCLPLWLLIKKY